MKIFSQSQSTPRIWLFFIGILLKIIGSALSGVGFVLTITSFSFSGFFVWVAFLVVLFLVACPPADIFLKNQMRWLKPAAITIAVFFCIVGLALIGVVSTVGLRSFETEKSKDISHLMTSFETMFGYNDATALAHQAANNLLDGKNPYAVSNIVTATIEFHGTSDKLTPLREGSFANIFPYPTSDQLENLWQSAKKDPSRIPPEFESKFNYPAGAFLLPAPFVWMGVGDLRLIFLIFIIPALVYVIIKVPSRYRLLFIVTLIASLELWNSLAAGETGLLYFPFLLLAWVLYRRNLWVSAIFMAIAVATKQTTWFFLPFYLVIIFRSMGWRKVLAVAGIIGGVFVAANAWFFVSDPALWVSSILAPVTDKMFPMGVGIITLVSSGLVPIHSGVIFDILEVGAFVLAIVWYYFNCHRYPDTAPMLSVLPLFFAWRSLWGYFFYIDIIILASVLINEYGKQPAERLGIAPALTATG